VFGPFVTFVIFAINSTANGSSPLSEGKTFSSLAIVSLLTSPASQFLESLPLVGMATSGLQRIEAFLRASSHDDQRTSVYTASENSFPDRETRNAVELQNFGSINARNGIMVEGISVRPSPEAPVVLQDISFRAPKESLTMVIGVVGSGKSTLLKALAGELTIEGGCIEVASKYMAYCAQTPWLQNATVRQIICGPTEEANEHRGWYDTVAHACVFDEDILQLPNRDDTIIGSRGVTLSGGQKQRLVRAAFRANRPFWLTDVPRLWQEQYMLDEK
jgi:ATP-binding cassette, subfamily C (CFTR/MRP), member 1